MGTLASRGALVVGGASGIGLAIAKLYAREGARVVIADRDEARSKIAAESLDHAHAVTTDVTDPDSVDAACAEARSHLGSIDILVNSAGILEQDNFVDLSVADWQRTISVDLTGVFLFCRNVVPTMVEARWGRVINIASQLGVKGGRGLTHYSAAKAGVIGFTKALALEVSEHNVLVNCIAPGPIETPLIEGVSAEWKRAKTAELPLGRFGTPEEVAPSAVLLASEPGGNLFVGQTLGPNSGDVMQ
ncbi:3-oxoacyl-ACP reductase [Rhodococcus sp. 06-621-2]|nr:SDR family NAD(P)-dependent oxidoreductase [Rhodococcus sp. 06-621-2]OZC55468.1 3-oxoacyl-ACP reductase [Rhodococcus sp. 06-621-2]